MDTRPRRNQDRALAAGVATALVEAALLAAGMLCAAAPDANSAASYTIVLRSGTQTASTPLHQTFWTATPGVAPTVIQEEAAANPGQVGARCRLETSWPFEIQTGLADHTSALAASDDFLITGPTSGGSVPGAMRFHACVHLDRGGGLAASASHRAAAALHVTAGAFHAEGSGWFDNQGEGSDGVLAGVSPPGLEVSFSLPGDYPVGVPFTVTMEFEAADQTFGDSTGSPGFTETDGLDFGVALGDGSGQVMDLPPGYTVNAPDWGVSSNVAAGVPPDGGEKDLELASPQPNPSAANVAIHLSLPRAGDVDLSVIDLQGRTARRLWKGELGAGPHDQGWNGRDGSGKQVAPGLYWAVLRFEHRTLTRRLARVR